MLITFEGIEGAGKGTLIQKLTQQLDLLNVPFLCTRQPGGTSLGTHLRSLLLDARQHITPQTELFLYLADRTQHVHEVIAPALKKNMLVLCDRYADSTIVYQGYGRNLDVETLEKLNDIAVGGIWPDMTFLLDLPPEIGLERAQKRNEAEGKTISEGRFEAEKLSFHKAIRNGYLQFAQCHPKRFIILDATLTPDVICAEALSHLKPYISKG